MQTNEIPKYDICSNQTGCCPRFDPDAWDEQELHFENKPFVKASTVSFLHIPLNMGARVHTHTRCDRGSPCGAGFCVLSRERSAWRAEHLFAVAADVPDAEMVHLSGDFLTKVFEGPYRDAPKWCRAMSEYVARKGKALDTLYFFYTTCPRCAKHYGKNYVTGVAKVR